MRQAGVLFRTVVASALAIAFTVGASSALLCPIVCSVRHCGIWRDGGQKFSSMRADACCPDHSGCARTVSSPPGRCPNEVQFVAYLVSAEDSTLQVQTSFRVATIHDHIPQNPAIAPSNPSSLPPPGCNRSGRAICQRLSILLI
jgi:hypothetical protein